MGSKAVEKRNYILAKAIHVFIREGYTSVTMKDIVEECGISRGGLYKYFSSTKEIFEGILSSQKSADNSYFYESMKNKKNAVTILTEFLQQQKEELLNIDSTIRLAIYEFFLSQKDNSFEGILEQYFNDAVAMISKTLSYGIERKEIMPLDTDGMARQIVILLEGLTIMALSMSVSPTLIDEQIDMMIKRIVST
ncbi:TetR/AcrR family transcriptional regulator [Paenibacillus sp. EZ-K15]|uniref:TetR/AcrR family transcriptional regulator n=1 Tax=Paenibacillus sp. EZ-K15 TaxID=2044275 RepID=UPI000BF55EA9|nr:TetR/AcrR family transcriptional regulator [Paenibacillus sp. EZ-K15]